MRGLHAARRRWILAQLVARDGSRCHYCACELDAETLTLEHIWPRSRRVLHCLWNLVLACRDCNHGWLDAEVKCLCAFCSRARAAGRLLADVGDAGRVHLAVVAGVPMGRRHAA